MDTGKILSQLMAKYHYLGSVIEGKWNDFLDIVGDDPQTLWVFGTAVIFMLVYWLGCAFYTFMDITNRPKFLRKYKIQPGKNEPVDGEKLKEAILNILMNQTITGIPMYFILYHILFKERCNLTPIREIPSLPKILLDIVVVTILEEFYFYYIHRLMHHKSIYKYVHKKHHEWTAPIAVVTFYSHPLEHIFSNLVPISLSLGLMRSHIFSAWIILTLGIFNSMADHTGYSFPYSGATVRFHDYHHSKNKYNYGLFGWLDKLHGTYKETKVDIENAEATESKQINKVKNIVKQKQKSK